MVTTEARTATDVVRAYFDALHQGQFDSLGVTLSGVYTGKAAVFELFGSSCSERRHVRDRSGEDDHGERDFVAATLQFHARRGTEQIAVNGVDVMRVRDGQIVEVWLFSADQQSEDAFWSRALRN